MTRLTPEAVGMSRIRIGTGPYDSAYAGHGYQIRRPTRRVWVLTTVSGRWVASAHRLAPLLATVTELVLAAPRTDTPERVSNEPPG